MKKTVIILVGVLAVVGVLFINAVGSAIDSNGYQIGDEVNDFKLEGIDGNKVSLSAYPNAKGYVVVFTCNTCPYAKMYEQRINDLNKKYEPKGFPVIAINPNDINRKPGDSMEEMKIRAKNKGYTFKYLRDDTQEVAKRFGATKTPHVYVLNSADQNYRVEYIGAIDNSPNNASGVTERYVENAINALLSGKKPKVTEEPAIGCTIKWAES